MFTDGKAVNKCLFFTFFIQGISRCQLVMSQLIVKIGVEIVDT